MVSKYFSVSNFFSACRLFFSPFVYYFLLMDDRLALFVLLFLGGLTDFLDGFFARRLNQVSDFGAKLDSFADFVFFGTFLFFFAGKYAGDLEFFGKLIFAGFGFLFTAYVVFFIRFKKFASFHLYSMKVGGFLGYFGVVYFSLFGVNFLLAKIALTIWFFACVETFFASLLIKKVKYNAGSVFLLK